MVCLRVERSQGGRRRFSHLNTPLGLLLVVLSLAGCAKPPIPPYPYWGSYGTEAGVTQAARDWSGDPDWEPDGKGYKGNKQGRFTSGVLWLRMYGLDHAHRPQGGVKYPKVTYQLPDGRRYFIAVDFSKEQARLDKTRALAQQAPVEMKNPGVGWTKMMSILRAIFTGIARAFDPEAKWVSNEYLRDLYLGGEGRGEGQSGSRGCQPAATCAVHIDYLNRDMCLGAGKVLVVTGRMPTTPDTRSGAGRMTAAQARYWSLTGYEIPRNLEVAKEPGWIPGVAQLSVMDDEIVKNAKNEYVLVFCRPQDRLANATAANGVTWVDCLRCR